MENLRLEKLSIEHEMDFLAQELRRMRGQEQSKASAPPSSSPATLRTRK